MNLVFICDTEIAYHYHYITIWILSSQIIAIRAYTVHVYDIMRFQMEHHLLASTVVEFATMRALSQNNPS